MRPRTVDTLIKGELTDGEFVISLLDGERALVLNGIGYAVLELCDGTRTVEDIASFLRTNMTVAPNVDVSRDVQALVDELVRAGVVEALT